MHVNLSHPHEWIHSWVDWVKIVYTLILENDSIGKLSTTDGKSIAVAQETPHSIHGKTSAQEEIFHIAISDDGSLTIHITQDVVGNLAHKSINVCMDVTDNHGNRERTIQPVGDAISQCLRSEASLNKKHSASNDDGPPKKRP